MDDLEQGLRDIADWVGHVDPPDHETLTLMPAGAIGRPTWQRGLAAAAAVLLVVAGVWAITRNHGDRDASGPTPSASWDPTAHAPLSPRNDATGVWTGKEVIVFSGTTQIDCPMCDYAAYGDTLTDGAAYDPTTNSWRPIAPLPDAGSYVGTAVAYGGDVYYYTLSHPDVESPTRTWALLRYVPAADAWDVIPLPEGAATSATIVASPWGVVLFDQGSPLDSVSTDFLLQADGTWTPLPAAPVDSTYMRTMVHVGDSLVLFTTDPPDTQSPTLPPVLHAAVLDRADGTWRRLPDGDQLVAPLWGEGSVAVAPFGGGADGGEVNGWGRTVPNGGILDLADGTWRTLPQPTPIQVAGVIGSTGAWFGGLQGSVLDLASQRWLTLPAHPRGQQWGPTVVAMGRDLFTFGGNHDNTLHADSYVWHSGGSAGPDTVPETVPGSGPDTVPVTDPSLTSIATTGIDVRPSGGCGAIGFDALSPDASQHLAVYMRMADGAQVASPVDVTAQLPDEQISATFSTGVNLNEFSGCNDVISSGRIDNEVKAVGGTLHVTAGLKDGATTWDCGNVQADLTITGLVLADGRGLADMTIHSDSVNCFGG